MFGCFFQNRSKVWLLLPALFLAACAGTIGQPTLEIPLTSTSVMRTSATGASPQPIQANDPLPSPALQPELLPEEEPPRGATQEFKTDFTRRSVPYSEILSGGPPKDGIPSIDHPQFITVAEADEWLGDLEPVIYLQVGDDARAYPLQILTWHEIVNDTVGDVPLTVTFCPLCNTAIAFERTLDGQVLDFGTTGRLRYSNLIMYDRQTETWWQQATGEAIAGEFTGQKLITRPATIIAWGEFKGNFLDGLVLSRETGFRRDYGRNPYAGYDDINRTPFLFEGPQTPGALLPMARVLTLEINGEAVAYPYEVLESAGVVIDMVGGEAIVVFWQPGTASALDSASISEGRDVGAAAAFSREIDGQTLTFSHRDGKIFDEQTGSEWDIFGKAIGGELTGVQLDPAVAINHFWFSWAAFKPETRIYQP